MPISVQVCTRRSRTHERNEDRAVVCHRVLCETTRVEHERITSGLVAVLDGLGGHPAGDVASEIAGRILADADVPTDEDEAGALLRAADVALQDAMREVPEHFGMGATAAMLAVDGDREAVVANVGDASAWHLDADASFDRLTLPDRVDGGRLLQCLGADGEYEVTPHTLRLRLAPGASLLLATDGLTDVVRPERIARELQTGEDAAARLSDAVEEAGRPDDTTIVVVERTTGR